MSTHTLIHIGDAHVYAAHPRNADRLASLDQIIDYGLVAPRLAAWVWPGDLYHTKSTPEDRNAIAERLVKMAAVAPVLLTVGNHETAADLRIFGRLHTRWPVLVVERPEVVRFTGTTGCALAAAVLPYPHRAGLVSAGTATADVGQVARDALTPIFHALAAELVSAADQGAVPFFAAHVNIGGAVTSGGQPAIGHEIELDPALLNTLGPVAKMLNHIHRHQELHGAVYAGSTARHDFGENEPKGFVEWTYDDECATWAWAFRPLQVPEQFRVEGRLAIDGFAFDHDDWMCAACAGEGDGPARDGLETLPCAACNGTGRRSWEGADVRVRYRYRRAEASVIDVSHIERLFAGARSLKLEPDPQHDVEVRAPEIAAARTLDEKLQHYFTRAGIVWTDGVAEKAAALQQQDGEALLAALDARLADVLAAPAPTKAKVA